MSAAEPPALLDTSVVVRYLTGDPPPMADRAAEIIDSDHPLLLSDLVLVETAYVLASVYEIPRAAIVDALTALIQRRNLSTPQIPKTLALEALRQCRDSHRVSFADALLWAEARASKTPRIYSFDQKFPGHGLEIIGLK